MKTLILSSLMVSTSFAGVVECMKYQKRIRPANTLAFKLAANAGSSILKTCTGESFLKAVKDGKHTTKLVQATAARVQAYEKYAGTKAAGKSVSKFLSAGK